MLWNSDQGIIDSTGTETWPILSYMLVTAKKIKELFTPTENVIAASVRCVSSTPVILNARSSD